MSKTELDLDAILRHSEEIAAHGDDGAATLEQYVRTLVAAHRKMTDERNEYRRQWEWEQGRRIAAEDSETRLYNALVAVHRAYHIESCVCDEVMAAYRERRPETQLLVKGDLE